MQVILTFCNVPCRKHGFNSYKVGVGGTTQGELLGGMEVGDLVLFLVKRVWNNNVLDESVFFLTM